MNLKILLLPGDGIGAEVTSAAVTVLNATLKKFGHTAQYTEGLIGGTAIHQTGKPLPEDTMQKALEADATLMGAVGLPEFDNTPPSQRPERGLLDLRGGMKVFANLRPVKAWSSLIDSSPLKNHLVEGVDLLIVRELTGGLYFGTPRGIVWDTEHNGAGDRAYNTMNYSREEITRVARKAFQFARQRRKHLTSVDKPNVLECSQLWRKVVTEIAAEYPDVTLEHMLVDTCAMQLVLNPKRFDVILTENMFGDILSDEGAVLAGSIGMLPSASLGEDKGLYEPVHGSAPDIAGQNKANPLGAIGSAAAMLEYSFGLVKEAAAINAAVEKVLNAGQVTADLKPKGKPLSTSEVGIAVSEAL
ncbi:MAG: 3-isopropylmalate dehydrogenase [Bryobacteraceae bacterium]